MNLKLVRFLRERSGIYGKIVDDRGNPLLVTLEHSYPYGEHGWAPKMPSGNYTCKRGHHELHSGPIETFEITGVPGHQGILFHCGNTEDDSEGCVLLGMTREGGSIAHSRTAFQKFLEMQAGVDEFTLTVEG